MHYAHRMQVSDFYGRKSSKDDGRSIASQEDEWREDCDDQGFVQGRVFADSNRSASRYARKPRPDFDQLLDHVRAGQCQVLSMWESSRGSRNLADWIGFLDLCRDQGTLIRIIEHRRTYDIRVRRDWRTLAEDGIDSADESEKTSERTRRGKRRAAKEGRPDARLAYGFSRIYDDRGALVEQVAHPEQAPIVVEIVTGFDEGKSAGEIARELNRRRVPVPQRPCPTGCTKDHRHFPPGMTWSDSQVRSIATKPSYAGHRVYLGEIVGPGSWEPIVDPAVWQRVHHRLTAGARQPARKLAHWLIGAVLCGMCGNPMGSGNRANNQPGRRHAYTCRACHRVSTGAHQLEAFLEPLIDKRLQLPDAKDLFVPRTDDAAVRAADDELGELERRLAEFRAEGKKPRGLSAAAVAEAEQGLTPLIEAARLKLKALVLPPSVRALAGVDVTKWKTWNPRARRDLVAAVGRIVLAPGRRDGGRAFDPWRLAESRWTGDEMTWGEHWRSEGWIGP